VALSSADFWLALLQRDRYADRITLVADLVMSLDNVVAVAAMGDETSFLTKS
jgi:predicted tellurium resistance membrane protein TerC